MIKKIYILYRMQQYVSDDFNVTNGVRQCGILSPYIFNLYMNNLSVELLNSNTGY